jgi:hypothetical protein
MNKVYAVSGWKEDSGESDRDWEWVVCCYTEEEMAQKHVKMLKEAVASGREEAKGKRDKLQSFRTELDPKLYGISHSSWYGPSYTVEEIGLFLHVDQFMEQVAVR